MLRATTPQRPRRESPEVFGPTSPPSKAVGCIGLDDACSTAAPSPALAGFTSPLSTSCPWGSPFTANISPRQRFTSPQLGLTAQSPAKPTQLRQFWQECYPCHWAQPLLQDVQMFRDPPPVPAAAFATASCQEGSPAEASIAYAVPLPAGGTLGLAEGAVLAAEEPTTPRDKATAQHSPPGAPRVASMPPLLAALCRGSEEEVCNELEEDPQAALDPFFDHGMEPPLCSAIRHGCDVGIIRLLLQHGADVTFVDARGRGPLSLLASTPCPLSLAWPELPTGDERPDTSAVGPQGVLQRNLDVADLLVKAGADPMAVDAAGSRPYDLAVDSGNWHLARHWLGASMPSAVAGQEGSVPSDWARIPANSSGAILGNVWDWEECQKALRAHSADEHPLP